MSPDGAAHDADLLQPLQNAEHRRERAAALDAPRDGDPTADRRNGAGELAARRLRLQVRFLWRLTRMLSGKCLLWVHAAYWKICSSRLGPVTRCALSQGVLWSIARDKASGGHTEAFSSRTGMSPDCMLLIRVAHSTERSKGNCLRQVECQCGAPRAASRWLPPR